MLLADLVAASSRVASTRSRLAKLRELAQCLRALDREEIAIGVMWLSGETQQGKIGIGYAAVQQERPAPATTPTLTLLAVDRAFSGIMATRGTGSASRRKQQLDALLSRATAEEQSFLLRLMVGELRQGALAGLMVDAIAEAAKVPLAEVRRAAMY